MSEDALELVLNYARDHTAALASAPGILGDVLGCDVCNSLMVEPYTLECGHSFCYSCLHSWTYEREGEATCPSCRQHIGAQPHRNLGLRQLALAVAASYNADAATTAKIPEKALASRVTPEFPVREEEPTAIWDSADDVYRCPRCTHEVEDDGECPSCGVRWGMPGFNTAHYSDFPDSDASSQSDLDSFIDDEASDDSGLNIVVNGDDDDSDGASDEGMDTSDEESRDAEDTSDDSLLEEAREDLDSDVEVTTVVHRPRAMVDDDDD